MVSMSSPQTVNQAEGYLEKENYYQENSMLGTFQGNGLEHLGIEKGTTVDAKIYKTLLQGFHPKSGEKLVRNAGKEDHRAGFDVTFSAPKSVSILMEYYEANGQNVKAEMIRKAHDLAVKNSMEKLENGSAKTRLRVGNGERIRVDSDIIYATFQHDTSREVEGKIDPQLHTHNFIFTPTFYTDEKTGEVRSMALTNEEIFKNKMYFGQNYRSELASNLAELGYKIEVSDRKNGFFEVEGLTRKQIENFSSRENLILEKLPEYREKYPKMKESELLQVIKSDTKNAKKELDREAVREHNLERMEAVGIDKTLINSMENRGQKAAINEEIMTIHIEKSLENIIDRQSLFTKEELSKMVLKYGLEYGYTESDYAPFVAKHSEIVQLGKNVFSTKEMIRAERNVILSVRDGVDKFTEFAPYNSQILQSFMEEKYPTLTDEQVKMVKFILGNKDQFIAIQGDAGTGKTFAAKVVRDYLKTYHAKQEIIGLSFTGRASQGLEEDTNIKSQTVHSFLAIKMKAGQNIKPKNRLIIVDEAGMIGSKQMNDLVENAKLFGDRIVFMGDTKQFRSISAGNIFNDMQKYGTKTVRLSQAIRFESELTKEATTSLKMEMVKKSLESIKEKGTLKELSRDNQVETIAKNYSNLSKKEQKETLIIASTNKDKEAINWSIRSEKELGGNSYKVQSHSGLNGIEKHYSEGYEIGARVAIQGELEGFKGGQKLYVTGRIDDKTITVKGGGKRAKEKQINVYEHGDKLQVFREIEKPFAKGEVIVFTKNTVLDKKSQTSVKNGERTRIKSINKHGDIVTAEGKKFNIKDMPYVDHGYAITDVKSQGSTYKNVVVMAKAEMASFHSFYTQITRAKHGIELYTDNKELLESNVLKPSDFKTTLDYTIKKKEKEPAKEVKQEASNTRTTTKRFENIQTSKYIPNSIEIKEGRANNLRKVGVYQTNVDTQMKIDIYRNSIGKLDGIEPKKTTVPHKKYRGIEVAIKQQKEQTHGQAGRDTRTTKDNLIKSRQPREESRLSKPNTSRRDQERSTANQGRDARGRQNDGSRAGVFAKVKGTFTSLLKKDGDKTYDTKTLDHTKQVPTSKIENRNIKEVRQKTIEKRQRNTYGTQAKERLSEDTAKRGLSGSNVKSRTLQSSTHTLKRGAIPRDTSSLRGLSSEPLVRNKPSPKVLLQGDVSSRVGWKQSISNNGMRREGNGNHETARSQGEGIRSIEEQRMIEKIKAFKGAKQSSPTYTPDKSKSLEERIKAFKQHKDMNKPKEKSKEIER